VPCYKENGFAACFSDHGLPAYARGYGAAGPDPSMTGEPALSEWDAGDKGLNEGLTKLLVTLKNEKASIKQQRIERGMEAKFSKLPNKDLPKGSGL
jgi:hypothetical protein